MRLFSLCLATLSLVLFTLPAQAQWQRHQWEIMGTRASVTLWSEQEAGPLFLALEQEMQRLNDLLSPWVADSELARVNQLAHQAPQQVSAEFYRLLQTSQHYFTLTDGAFDISFASAGHLYDYRAGTQPSDAELVAATQHIDANQIQLQDHFFVALKNPNIRIDLGGIAKGYAIDQGIALLKKAGIEHAYLSLGGDSYVLGDRKGRPWLVGIQHPRNENKVSLQLPVSDLAMSTSGDYQRFFMVGEERIHHIISPSTGKSAQGLVSVTVLTERSIDADALSTSVFVLGKEKGLALINRLPNTSAILIDSQGRVSYSDDLTAPE